VQSLIFHLTPLSGPAESCWRWHLRLLNKYADVFDGQRIFAIATGSGMIPESVVLPLLPPRSRAYTVPNNPNTRETESLPMLLEKARSESPGDMVFYAHSKGLYWVSTPMEAPTRWWSLAMYRWLLGTPHEVKKCLGWRRHDGTVTTFPDFSRWHYQGTFFWFNAKELYACNWRQVDKSRYGTEAYLSRFFGREDAACHHCFAGGGYGIDPVYSHDFWKRFGIPEGAEADGYHYR